MNLLEIRQKLREISGRFDLVDANGADTGANFFINEGSRYLDRKDETQKSWASCFRLLEIGKFSASFPYCRAIKEVWIIDGTNGRWQLEKKNLQDLIAGYLGGFPSERTSGTPLYFSPCITRVVAESLTIDKIESFIGMVEIPAGNAHEYNSIILNVPVSQQSVLDIRGLFYSEKLLNDTDKNYWSVAHPFLLLNATMRCIEVANRNTQGVNDWDKAIGIDMKDLGMDLVEEQIAEVSEMEG